MTTGVLMVFAVLVLLFARVLQPITILSSLPLSLSTPPPASPGLPELSDEAW